jgi:NAD(P)-dependent dehydrogenase (short-subunit alcohol dehydrogenase family)
MTKIEESDHTLLVKNYSRGLRRPGKTPLPVISTNKIHNPYRSPAELSVGSKRTIAIDGNSISGREMKPGNRNHLTRFDDQVVLVVGGAQGIGKAIAVRMGLEGAHMVIADVDRKMMAAAAKEMEKAGSRVRTIFCDVRKSAQVNRMVNRVIDWHERIDVLIYAAGVCKAVPFLRTDERLWDWTIDTNLKGAFLVAREVSPHMVKRRRGKLIFIASTNSWDAEALQAPYNVSKAGVFILAKSLARELGIYGINSNAVGPGFIRTRLTEQFLKDPEFMQKYTGNHLIPLGRFGTPEDVTGPAAFLASHDADYVNGVLLFVDGGQLA